MSYPGVGGSPLGYQPYPEIGPAYPLPALLQATTT